MVSRLNGDRKEFRTGLRNREGENRTRDRLLVVPTKKKEGSIDA